MDSRDFITPSPGNTNESGYEGSPQQPMMDDFSMPPPDFMVSGMPPVLMPPMDFGPMGGYPAMEAWGPPQSADPFFWGPAPGGPMPPPMGPGFFQPPPPVQMQPTAYYQPDSVPPTGTVCALSQGMQAPYFIPYPPQLLGYAPPEFHQQPGGHGPNMAPQMQQQHQQPPVHHFQIMPDHGLESDESQWSDGANGYSDAGWEEEWRHMESADAVYGDFAVMCADPMPPPPPQQPPHPNGGPYQQWNFQQGPPPNFEGPGGQPPRYM